MLVLSDKKNVEIIEKIKAAKAVTKKAVKTNAVTTKAVTTKAFV